MKYIKDLRFGLDKAQLRWVHLASDHIDSESTISELGVPQAATEGLMTEDTRPKCVELEGGVLIYLRSMNLNHGAEPEDMVSVRLWVKDNLIVTTTKQARDIEAVKEIEHLIGQHTEIKDTGDFLCVLIDEITDAICDEVDNCEDRLDALEAVLNEDPDDINRMEIIDVRRECAQIKRFILPQRHAVNALHTLYDNFSSLQSFRIKEQSERVLRYVETIDLLMERSLLIQEELRSLSVDKQSQRMYVLSLVSAIFLPLSFLTGVFGVNVAGLPGLNNPNAFIWLSVIMLGLAVAIVILMKLKKWL